MPGSYPVARFRGLLRRHGEKEYVHDWKAYELAKGSELTTSDLGRPKVLRDWVTGMLNVSPIGRNCSQAERDDFEKYSTLNLNPQTLRPSTLDPHPTPYALHLTAFETYSDLRPLC